MDEERSSMDSEQDEDNDKFVAGQMEIDDAEENEMAEVADILLRLEVNWSLLESTTESFLCRCIGGEGEFLIWV